MGEILLYQAPDCPYSERVRLVLEHLGIPYDVRMVDPQAPPAELRVVNPYGLVPALVHEGQELYESNIITAYLDERFDGGLMPDRPADRARVRILMHHADRYWMPIYRRLVRARRDGPDAEIEAALEAVRRRLRGIERRFAREGPFLMGAAFTLADVAFATSIPSLDARYACRIPTSMPRLSAWVKAVEALPAWGRAERATVHGREAGR